MRRLRTNFFIRKRLLVESFPVKLVGFQKEFWKIVNTINTRDVHRSINFCASTVDLSRAEVDDSRLIFRTKKYGEKALFLIKTSDVVYILFDSLESDKLLKHTWTKYHIFSANWFSSV